MKKNLRLKALFILAIIALFTYALNPPKEKIRLGLDLRGGIHLIMKVNAEDALNAVADDTATQIADALTEAEVRFQDVKKESATVLVAAGLDPNKETDFRKRIADSFPAWEATREDASNYRLKLRPAEESRLRHETVTQAIETIRRRVDGLGVSEALIAPHGDRGNQILVQLPGFDDVARAKELIRSTAKLELTLVEAGPASTEEALRAARPDVQGRILPEVRPNGERVYWLLARTPVITGRDLKNARQSIDPDTSSPDVSFTLKPEAAARFGRITGANIDRQLAIVLDDRVESAPTIQSKITDRGQITGRYTLEEAHDLALKLRSGALPASLEYQEERTIGPSLGADSIKSGVTASLAGLLFVVVFLLIYYKLAGVNAVVALALNLLLLMGAMVYLNAALTLPGIAGVILTIGMGVDSNVLIFERIKEEVKSGKTPRTAISVGFSKVFWTIFDTHLTSLVAAIILLNFGTGPVQGFAVTLFIGLVANVFTSVFVSRFLFDLFLGSRHVEAVSI